MRLLVVGSVALDSISTPFGDFTDGLGGSAVYFSVAASLLTGVQVVGEYPVTQPRRLRPIHFHKRIGAFLGDSQHRRVRARHQAQGLRL